VRIILEESQLVLILVLVGLYQGYLGSTKADGEDDTNSLILRRKEILLFLKENQ